MNYMYKLCGTALAVLFSVSVSSQIPFTKVETKNMMRKVADWQIAHPNTGHEHDDVSWTHAVLYAGMADWAELSEKEDGYDFYYRWLLRIGSRSLKRHFAHCTQPVSAWVMDVSCRFYRSGAGVPRFI